ncbi:(2Fe-2S)-binding protein [Streptomyces sp. NBC_01571]|uniref:(2Fe-2S)-binding protein n=1 Tax=Streptomyces sp. NBC_01571 TaxID=2975883 RepID=UPI0022559665|nr:(2Fe-2S)-binding protein [Streptomyces sp. NBC_01571]MCX4575281.1 (2Fe-2S)-binding protein [Streptomyces sp. NBC_01571]
MTDDQHEEGAPQGRGRWDPLPQGDYDDGATAFVKLPEGGIEALLAERDRNSNSPLAAPGHGYVPPEITAAPPAQDQGGTDAWGAPGEAAQWPEPGTAHQDTGHHRTSHDGFSYHPGATGQWDFGEVAQEGASGGHHAGGAPGHDVTGQWSIPVAGGDLPDESGEFTTSALVEQWGGTPPATLPGGASAPWATTEAIGEPWSAAPPTAAPEAAEAPGAPARPTHAERPAEAAQQAVERAHEASEPVAGPLSAEGTLSAPLEAREPDSARPPGPASGEDDSTAPDAEVAAADAADEPSGTSAHDEHPLASYVLRVNGADRPVTDAWIGESLLYVLRERLGLAGAKDGCSQGECGACNVQVDGRLVASCLVPGVTAAGSEVRTVEGLAADGQPSDVQRALAKCGAVQCGFCVPGMAMTVHDLLEGNPAPTELEARQALCGNLCRCSGYRGVLDAVREVVAEREAHSAAAAESVPDADEPRIPHQAGPGAGGVNPSAYEDPSPYDARAPYEQPYGQDGGQA